MTKIGCMIAAAEGAASISYDTALAILSVHAAPIDANGARKTFLRGTTSYQGVGDRQDASRHARLARSNALVRRRAHAAPVLPGMLVPTLPLCC